MENIRILQMQNFIVIYVLWKYILKQSNTCNATYSISTIMMIFFSYLALNTITFNSILIVWWISSFLTFYLDPERSIFFSRNILGFTMQKLKYIFFLNVCDFQLTSIRDMEVQLYELNLKKNSLAYWILWKWFHILACISQESINLNLCSRLFGLRTWIFKGKYGSTCMCVLKYVALK